MRILSLFYLALTLLLIPFNAQASVIMKFENRWPLAPEKIIATSNDYVFQAIGNVILVLDKDNLTAAEPVKRIYLNVTEGITNLTYSAPYLYATTGHHGLNRIEVSPSVINDPPIVIQEPIPSLTEAEQNADDIELGTSRGVAILNNQAYVAYSKLSLNGIYETGIQMVDAFSQSTAMPLGNAGIASSDAIGEGLASGLTESRSIQVSGNYAYIADTAQGMHLFRIDSGTPEFVTIAGFLPSFSLSVPGDGYAYIACTAGGIQILDIATDPNLPSIATVFPSPTDDNPNDTVSYFQYNDATTFARSVQVVGSYAYVADGNSGLEVIDVSDRAQPQKLATYGTDITSAYSLYVDTDNSLYLADFQSGLTKIDISTQATPTRVATVQHKASRADRFFVNIEGDIFYAYTLDSSAADEGLRILEFKKVSNIYGDLVSNSEFQNVRFRSFLETPGQAQDIKVVHYDVNDATTYSYAFIADGTSGIQIIDVTNKYIPTNTNLTSGLALNDSRGVALDSSGSFAFVADGANGTRIVQVLGASDSYPVQAPTLLDTIAPPSGGEAKDILFGSRGSQPSLEYYLYVAAGSGGLQIIQLDLPETAGEAISGSLVGTLDTDGDALSVDIYGNYAYIADGAKGLKIINISDPAAPTQVGSFETSGTATRVWVRQAANNRYFAYIANGDQGVLAIDVSDPTKPQNFDPVLSYDTVGYASDIAVNVTGDMTIVGDGSGGLTMLSISDPEAAQVVDTYTDYGNDPDISQSGCFVTSLRY